MPTLSTFNLPNESESLEKEKSTTMNHIMPPTPNCFNRKTTPVHRICPQLVQKSYFMRRAWGETESSDTSEESSPIESLKKFINENTPPPVIYEYVQNSLYLFKE